MPVVGRSGVDNINIFVFEKLADVRVGLNGFVSIFELLFTSGEDILVHIAKGDDPNAFDLAETFHVPTALTVEPYDCDPDVVIGALYLGPGADGQTQSCGG